MQFILYVLSYEGLDQQVVKAVDSLQYEFRAVDNLVARNSAKVLKAFQNARLGSHVSKSILCISG